MSKLPFSFAKPEDSPGFLLWQTTIIWQRQIKKALEPYHISHAQFIIMASVMWFEAHHYDITQILIANTTKLDKMTVSKSLKKLKSLGYVNRIEHKTDTRAKSISLTEKGRDMVRILTPIVESIDLALFNRASHEEQTKLLTILNRLVRDNEILLNDQPQLA